MKKLIGAKRNYLAVCLFVSLSACSTQAHFVTGEILDATGKQFLVTGKLFDQLFDDGHITAAQYRPWFVFAQKFKLVFKAAVHAWNKAITVKDSQDAADAIIAIKNELLQFYLAAQAKGQI